MITSKKAKIIKSDLETIFNIYNLAAKDVLNVEN